MEPPGPTGATTRNGLRVCPVEFEITRPVLVRWTKYRIVRRGAAKRSRHPQVAIARHVTVSGID
jgi:hypothetical protein